MKDLKNNDNIVITSADKGCAVVVMDKNDYVTKNLEHLNDS